MIMRSDMCEMATPAHNERSGLRSEMCEMAMPARNERSGFAIRASPQRFLT